MLNSTHKKIEVEKNWDKDEKLLHKLMDSAVYNKVMKNVKNKIDLRLLNNEKIIWNGHQNQGIYLKKLVISNYLSRSK